MNGENGYWQCGSINTYDAPSASSDETYRIVIAGLSESCSCPDYLYRKARAGKRCKHIEAVFFFAEQGNYPPPCQWSEVTHDFPKVEYREGEHGVVDDQHRCPLCGAPATWVVERDD